MKNLTVLLLIITMNFLLLREGKAQQNIKKSIKAGKNGNIEVVLNAGSIKIVPWGRNEVQVEAAGLYEEDADKIRISESGNTVRVDYSDGAGPSDEIRFIISLPAQSRVSLRTNSGDIEVNSGLKGELKGSTSGGDIRLGSVDGRVDLNTSGGDISSGDISGDVSFNTSGGDIRMGIISGKADVTTYGGDIVAKDVGHRLNAKTYGGDIIIGSINGDADISSYGGTISIKNVAGSAKVSTAGGDINLGGASGKVQVNTAGGDIILQKISGTIDAVTRNGDINVELLSAGKGDSRISTASGSIRLMVPGNVKATVEARIRVRGRWGDEEDETKIVSDFKPQSYNKNSNAKEIRAVYQLNGGGTKISLETVNSEIHILKIR
ncbi:MAG: DUF4097 family beta strand repeat-containing protein [Ignavibacteriales bacterium]